MHKTLVKEMYFYAAQNLFISFDINNVLAIVDYLNKNILLYIELNI